MVKYTKKNKRKSQHYKLEGKRTTANLRALLNEVVDDLEARGITEVTHGNLYFSLPPSEASVHLDVITMSEPYPCDADKRGL